MPEEFIPQNTRDVRIKRLMANTPMPNSRSLYEAFCQFERELTAELVPNDWAQTRQVTPFELPIIHLKKVGLEEVLEMLRRRMCTQYMPSATGRVLCNAKPQYLDEFNFGRTTNKGNLQFHDFPAIEFIVGYGTVAFNATSRLDHVFAYIGTDEVDIIVNLTTTDAIIRIKNGDTWFDWSALENCGAKVAFNPEVLAKCIAIHL